MKAVSDIQELIRVIAASDSKFSSIKGMTVEFEIWTGKTVRGSGYRGPKGADVISIITRNIDSNLLRPHIRSLLKTGKSFIVSMGLNRVEWTISDN